MMSEQFAALTNSVGEIQQRLINLEENMTLSSMVSIATYQQILVYTGTSSLTWTLTLWYILSVEPRVLMKNVHFSNRQRNHVRYIYLSNGMERPYNF